LIARLHLAAVLDFEAMTGILAVDIGGTHRCGVLENAVKKGRPISPRREVLEIELWRGIADDEPTARQGARWKRLVKDAERNF